jgi:hypothetical protein
MDTVLLVKTAATEADVWDFFLSAHGFRVVTATSASTPHLPLGLADIVLADLESSADGEIDVTAWLRDLHHRLGLAVVGVAGRAAPAPDGLDAVLASNAPPPLVLSTVRRCLRSSRKKGGGAPAFRAATGAA